jgi:ISXO2-like transposase domain
VFVNEKGWQQKRGTVSKRKVIALVERGGRSKSVKVDDLTIPTIRKFLFENIVLDSTLNTDEAQHYKAAGKEFAKHEAVKPFGRRICEGSRQHKHGGGVFLNLQAWNGRNLPALRGAASAKISERI